jgi:hypothetical protein
MKKRNEKVAELERSLSACPLFRRGKLEAEQEVWLRAEGFYEVPLSALELNRRCQKALRKLKVKTLGQLLATPSAALLSFRNLGKISLGLLREEALRYLCRKKDLPLPELGPSRQMIEKNALRTRDIVKMFYSLGTYAAVGRKLNLSRERVRQILERGRERRWIDWEPASSARRKSLRKEWTPGRLKDALMALGSVEQLKNRFHLKRWEVKFLMQAYKVDMADLRGKSRLERTLAEYRACRKEFGHDPSSTELFRSRRWKKLLPRIRKIWGSIDNFRRARGIPIPQRGGFWTPERTEVWRERMVAEGDYRRRLRGEILLRHMRRHGPLGIGQVEKVLGISYSTAQMTLDSLVARGKVSVSAGRRGRSYTLVGRS